MLTNYARLECSSFEATLKSNGGEDDSQEGEKRHPWRANLVSVTQEVELNAGCYYSPAPRPAPFSFLWKILFDWKGDVRYR